VASPDQTDERKADARLRESEARKTAVLDSSLDAIIRATSVPSRSMRVGLKSSPGSTSR